MPLQAQQLVLNGRYRVEALIGQGAFGEVYRVHHLRLDTLRAIKTLRRAMPGVSAEDMQRCRERFEFEARLGDQLTHPNVIKVYDFEEEGGDLYLVMEYAAGGSLAERVSQRGKLAIDDALRLAGDLCDGLEAIHGQLRAVHRDIKPSNVLFATDGHAQISDLGLAQVAGGMSQRSVLGSAAGWHPGTPAYMSPEQEGQVGYLLPASDVFALGCVLFESLTGTPYKTVYGSRLCDLSPKVPSWLDRIVARALAETPGRTPADDADAGKRYRRAVLLRNDLDEELQQERRQERARLAARERVLLEEADRELAVKERALQEETARKLLHVRLQVLDTLHSELQQRQQREIEQQMQSVRLEQACRDAIEAEISRSAIAICGNKDEGLKGIAFSTRGNTLATWEQGVNHHYRVRLWDGTTGRELSALSGHSGWVRQAVFSPDDRAMASASDDGTVKLWDIASRRALRSWRVWRAMLSVVFSPDGKLLAAHDERNEVHVWNVSTGREVQTMRVREKDVRSTAFSPDGKTLALGSVSKTISTLRYVNLYDVITGTELHQILTSGSEYASWVVFSPDGTMLTVWPQSSRGITLWDRATGGELRTLGGLDGHVGAVLGVAFSPDGRLLASASRDHTMKLWQVSDGELLLTRRGHLEAVTSVAFSPDGRLLASASHDKTVALWKVSDCSLVLTLRGHDRPIDSVAFSPDGQTLAAVSRPGLEADSVRLWRVSTLASTE